VAAPAHYTHTLIGVLSLFPALLGWLVLVHGFILHIALGVISCGALAIASFARAMLPKVNPESRWASVWAALSKHGSGVCAVAWIGSLLTLLLGS